VAVTVKRYACNPGGRGNNRALTRPRNPRMAREQIDPTLGSSVTGSRKHPLAGTADMKRVTAALREVNLSGSLPTLVPACTKDFSQTPSMLMHEGGCVLRCMEFWRCDSTVRLVFE